MGTKKAAKKLVNKKEPSIPNPYQDAEKYGYYNKGTGFAFGWNYRVIRKANDTQYVFGCGDVKVMESSLIRFLEWGKGKKQSDVEDIYAMDNSVFNTIVKHIPSLKKEVSSLQEIRAIAGIFLRRRLPFGVKALRTIEGIIKYKPTPVKKS